MVDLKPEQLKIVKNILSNYVADFDVWVYGSRISGTAREYSDLDLVIVGKEALSPHILNDLRDAFSNSDLTIMVDVHDWYKISKEFQDIIKRKYEILQVK
ncbi:MAG: nucleotidyltransferase domain-containing protein [Gammaproteobacteria bacterium]|nr:nucleotidyltransferase domain-containing protein [Gammaproteobacteria bacterium]